ncbi:GPP34 family phosphoprotein [Streptomyces sp. NPDC051776]|uniref:GOLPH3/VPS74 family protein n=1 Tax=Streptomyces sp. NPDC051776 TaxID=3155414 RepID=UPI00342C7879
MTTSRDLMITAMDVAPGHPLERGRLSLALAGAELIDLLAAETVTLDGDRIVPGLRVPLSDRLLNEAEESLVRESPYESVADWLWRRGRNLSSAYLAALEREGQVARRRRRRLPFRTGRTELTDSPDRRTAKERWTADEPVLAALGTALGLRGEAGPDGALSETDDAAEEVLAGVNDALLELEAVRQRHDIEQAAFDNIWRGD